ncbi:MAG: hypothetical protein ABR509_01385, partial [Candidatus Limnocylindria bacterium]
RSGLLTTAAIILIIYGVITALLGVLAGIAGGILGGAAGGLGSQLGEGAAFVGGAGIAVLIFGIIVAAIGILEIITGANLFGGKGWARVLGFIFAVLGILGGIIGLLSGIASQSTTTGLNADVAAASAGGGIFSIVFAVIGLVAHGLVIWALATSGAYFARR